MASCLYGNCANPLAEESKLEERMNKGACRGPVVRKAWNLRDQFVVKETGVQVSRMIASRAQDVPSLLGIQGRTNWFGSSGIKN